MLKRIGKCADTVSKWAGNPLVVSISLLSLVLSFVVGPIFKFSTTYWLIVNTWMSAISFGMLFILQHSQIREAKVSQLKLDTILLALENADHSVVGSEDLSEDELDQLAKKCKKLLEEIK